MLNGFFKECVVVPQTKVIQEIEIVVKQGKRLLIKGNPGMGKTTFVKKVAYGWSKGIVKIFYLVFVVFLNLVKLGDTIENVIIQQNPVLQGLQISSEMLKTILEIYGNRCLLILDGLDEHALGQNHDVLKVIKRPKTAKHPCSCNATTSQL